MVRCKNPNVPLLTNEEAVHSELFGSTSSGDETEEIALEEDAPAKRLCIGKATNVGPGKQLRVVAEAHGRDISDFMSDNGIEIVETDDANTGKKRKKGAKDEDLNIHQMFIEVGFANPIYPDVPTLKNLGIHKDVHQILKHCGLEDFYQTCHPAYPKLAAEFLATLTMHHFPDNEAMLDVYGGGMITFKLQGQAKQLEFKKINEVFGFAPGEPKTVSLRQEDKDTVWEMLTGEDDYPTPPKGTPLKNPAINYARRAIAQSFRCRHEPGNVNASDIEFLTIAFDSMFGFLRVERDLQGDQANAGLAYLLCKYLAGLPGQVAGIVRNGCQPKPLLCGGIITALIMKTAVPIAWEEEEKIDPIYMNVEFLRKHGFLAHSEDLEKYYYKYTSRSGQPVLFELPNAELTSIAAMENLSFEPIEAYHVDPSSIVLTKVIAAPKKDDTPRRSQKKKPPSPLPTIPCICTADGYEEKMVARLTDQITKDVEKRVRTALRAEMRREIDEEIHKGLGELKRAFDHKIARAFENPDRRAQERHRGDIVPASTRKTPEHAEKTSRAQDRTSPKTPAPPMHRNQVRVNSSKPQPPPPHKRT